MRRLRMRPAAGLALVTSVVGVLAVATPVPRLMMQRLVGGTDCLRFSEPAVPDVLDAPDQHFDGESGETVDTSLEVDDRSVDTLLASLQVIHGSQKQSAARSLELAREEAATELTPVQATISFNGVKSVADAYALVAQYGLRVTGVSHAFLGETNLFVGEIPTTDDAGVPQPPAAVADAYRDVVGLQVEQVNELFAAVPTSVPQPPVLTDVQARSQAASLNGPDLIGVIAEGTVAQVSVLAQSAPNLLVAVTPAECDAQNALIPDAWLPMVAQQLTDRPEGAEMPFIGESPGPEGRGD